MDEPKALKCTSCAAPLTYVSGETVVTCSYCGCTVIVHDDPSAIIRVREHFLVRNRLRPEALASSLSVFLSSRRLSPGDLLERLQQGPVDGHVLPYWVIKADSSTRWTGVDVCHRTEKDGENVRHRKEYEPRDGTFDKRHVWPVYGRRVDEYWGQEALKPGGLRVLPNWGDYPFAFLGFERSRTANLTTQREPFDVESLPEGMHIVNGQIDQKEAETEARQEIELFCWKEAKTHIGVLQQCNTAVTPRESALVHIPFWWLDYTYRGQTYHALFHGGSGELLCVEYPVGTVAKLCVSAGLAGLATLGLLFVPDARWRSALLLVVWGAFLLHLIFAFVDHLRSGPFGKPGGDKGQAP